MVICLGHTAGKRWSLILNTGEGNGNPLQNSCLENSIDRGAWWATVHGVPERVRHDLVPKQQQKMENETRKIKSREEQGND